MTVVAGVSVVDSILLFILLGTLSPLETFNIHFVL